MLLLVLILYFISLFICVFFPFLLSQCLGFSHLTESHLWSIRPLLVVLYFCITLPIDSCLLFMNLGKKSPVLQLFSTFNDIIFCSFLDCRKECQQPFPLQLLICIVFLMQIRFGNKTHFLRHFVTKRRINLTFVWVFVF